MKISLLCYNPLLRISRSFMDRLFLRAVKGLCIVSFAVLSAAVVFGQIVESPKPVGPKPAAPKPSPTPKTFSRFATKPVTAEDVAEYAVLFYAFPGGRATLGQIRKTTQERGRSSVTGADGRVEQAVYQRYVIRADSLEKEKIRLDQELPTAKFALVYNDEKIFGVYNNTVFTPREDALKRFENQIFHGLEALLRYKEDESKLELQPREKIMGVDYYIVDVIDKQERKTRFYVSAKTYRVMMLTYEDAGIKYKRRFYDYNYAQGTLVPSRSVLWADDKIVEESEVLTVTFGQKVDEALFTAGS